MSTLTGPVRDAGEDPVPVRSPDVAWVSDEEGGLVLLTLRTSSLMSLSASGAEVWALVDGSTTVPEIGEAVRLAHPEVPRARIVADVAACVDGLRRAGLLDLR